MSTVHRARARRPGRALLALGLATVLTTGGLTALAHADTPRTNGQAPAAAPEAAGYQMDRLDRGLISVGTGEGNLVSWRLLATDPDDVAFDLYRDGTRVNAEPITGVTNFLDEGATPGASYTLATVSGEGGAAAEPREVTEALAMPQATLDIPLSPPAGGSGYDYSANDASVGDLNGDGQLDIVLKWDPSNSKDNSQSGVTGNVYLDGLTLDGHRLWRIDLGRNIRAGQHYTQFQVFDYDGDGSAEVAVKTADGTVDGQGNVIGDAGADHRNGEGYVLSGPEYLTVFDGATGAALDTVDYVPARGNVSDWGDDYGNRVDRFLAATAYLDGSHPSLIMCRGYYTRSVIAAWDFDGSSLRQRWVFDSDQAGSRYAGQGSHSISVGDVDGDNRDEIVYGAMAVDDDGSPLWSTGTGHGDAQHLGDFDPDRPGLEYFKVSESSDQPGSLYLDPENGTVLWQTAAGSDNGRGVAEDIWADNPGAEFWSARDDALRNVRGEAVGRKPSSINFVVWWDGDATRELLDDTHIDKYGPDGDTRLLTATGVASNNGTKAVPVLSADILGDWREEVVWRTTDSSALRVYATDIGTDIAVPALLQDRMYRTGVAWQNTAYNQPPHPSFALSESGRRSFAGSPGTSFDIPPSALRGVPAGAPLAERAASRDGAAAAATATAYPTGAADALAVNWPQATGEIVVDETIEVTGDFDGGNVRYVPGSGLGDGGQGEDQDPVFEVREGGRLSNVIIGSPGADGVHCQGSCTLENVWWEDIGEDAATFRGGPDSQFLVTGGAARNGEDKVFQHNGGGTLTVRDFAAENFTTFYRSCGNCSTQYQRNAVLDGIEITVPANRVAGINENYGDTATLRNITIVGDGDRRVTPCQRYIGNDRGDEPVQSGSGPDGTYCRYTESDLTYR